MNILSLFDGISAGYLALKKAGVNIDIYITSEIDKYAIGVSKYNLENDKIIRLGDVTKIQAKDLPKIDMLIGGSPCTDFSLAPNKERYNFENFTLDKYLQLKQKGTRFEGQSYLIWEFITLLSHFCDIKVHFEIWCNFFAFVNKCPKLSQLLPKFLGHLQFVVIH